jgi:hypothetical protein
MKKHHSIDYYKDGDQRPRAKCDECNKLFKIRFMVFIKGKHLCSSCKKKFVHLIPCTLTVQEALEKVYIPKYYQGDGCNLSVPSCLMNKRVKFIFLEDIFSKSDFIKINEIISEEYIVKNGRKPRIFCPKILNNCKLKLELIG